MLRIAAVCSFAALTLPAQEAAAKAVPLQPIDLFRLDYRMTHPAEQPKDWLDAERYLVFDAGPKVMPGQGTPTWSAVEAKSGKRSPHVDHDALRQGLAHVEGADEALTDEDAFTWNEDHTRFVLNAGGDLFAAGLDGKAVRLTQTPDVAEVGVTLSPDGQQVAFVAAHDLHVVPTAGGEVRALTTEGHDDLFFGRLDWVYQEELYGRGNFQGYWWSPDSKRIALLRLDESPVQEFVLVSDYPARPAVERTNYPKVGEPNPIVDVGVIDVADGAARWFDLSAYPADDRLVVRVTWAPDAKEVLFQVQGREQTWLDMLAGDAAAGTVRKLWREDSDCWVEAGPEPEWLGGGTEFLWLSERDGFRHLYRFARSGEARGRLTEGEWQVHAIAGIDEANGCVYVTADRDSPLETHLYRVPLAGGAIERITKGRGTHEVKLAPDRRTFLTTWSDAETPPCTTLRGLDDSVVREIATSRPQLLRRHAPAVPRFVQVKARDGFPMEAMLLEPTGRDAAQPFPVVQFCYAGPHTPRVRDEWGGRDYLWHQLLVQRGYTVFVCDNRSASGKGRKYAQACWRQPGQSELRDLEDAADWIVAQGADPRRLAIWGWSYGGYQTLYNLTRSTKWKVGVAVNPVTDWRLYDTIYTERYFGLPTTNEAGYEQGSVVAAAQNLHGHLLLLCGAMDDNVHMQNSLQFLHALQAAGKDCDFMVYPRVRHGIESLPQQLHLWGRFERFLREKLQ